jgi:YHS domain-containing protein
MKKYFLIVPALFVLLACGHSGENTAAATTPAKDTTTAGQESNGVLPGLKNLNFAYAKDPACGMPLKAGLMDTTTYNGKLYGFCSQDCKNEFLKDPKGYTAKIK